VAYKKGEGGRPRGARNKRTVEFMSVLEKANFCPASALIGCYLKALADYEYYSELLRSNRISPMEDNSSKYLRIASDLAKDLSSYAYPKLKSIEQTKSSDEERPLKDLTDEELEAL
jgi:hypothetical protein